MTFEIDIRPMSGVVRGAAQYFHCLVIH